MARVVDHLAVLDADPAVELLVIQDASGSCRSRHTFWPRVS
jgi:hypothetical protein